MELSFSPFQILFTFILIILMTLNLFKQFKPKSLTPNLPPGPTKLPFIGNILDLAGPLPHQSLRNLAEKYGPLMHLKNGEISMIIASSAETAKEIMKIHDVLFANRPYLLAAMVISYGFKGLSFAPYGDYWRQLRKICAVELLSTKRVQSFRSIREEEVGGLIMSISEHQDSPVNLSERLSSLIYGITARAAFGKKCKDQDSFISLLKEIMEVAGGFSLADLFPSSKVICLLSGHKRQVERIHRRSDRILDEIIQEHKVRKAGDADEDLVDVLLKLHENGDIESMECVKAVILEMFGAGSETSATTIEWAMSEMLKNPLVMGKAQAEVRQVFDRRGTVDEIGIQELEFLKLVIKETLRIHPPTPLLLPRENGERCEINGYEIPAKCKVIVNAWAIGRDPKSWKDPERFYPERFFNSSVDYKGLNFDYIPFGAGRRICPGILFGIAIVELLLASLLYHFDWKLANGTKNEDLDMTETFGVTVRRKMDLYVIPIPYYPLPAF